VKLPNGDQVIIDERKVTDYCLSPDHDDGRHKAHLFELMLGVNLDNAELLLDALRHAAAHGHAVRGKCDRFGQRYVIDFEFDGPVGTATIRSAWIIRAGQDVPRLVTCFIL
jgi:hypothetical protein